MGRWADAQGAYGEGRGVSTREDLYKKDRKEHPLLFWWSGAMERGKWCEKT